MKKNLLFLLSLPLLLTACETTSSSFTSVPDSSLASDTSSGSSSSELALPTDVRSFLDYLSKSRNYTFTVHVLGSETTDLMTYYFTESIVGSTALDAPEYTDLRIQDEEGVYPLNYYEGRLLSGEYIEMADGSLCQDVWEISDTLLGKCTDYIASLPSGEEELTIEDKAYRIALLNTLGYDSSAIIELSDIAAEFAQGELSLSFTLEGEDLEIRVTDLGTTTVPLYDQFVSEGGDVYVPEETLGEMRRLFATDQMIITQSAQLTIHELLHPNYFFSCYGGSDMFSGYVAIDQPEEGIVGCYMAVGTGSFDANSVDGITGIQISTSRPVWDVPDMTQFYRYPSDLLLWSNLQFLSDGLDESIASVATAKGKAYHTYESNLLLDFVTNFSIDHSYPTDEYVPAALSFDVQLDEQDKTSVVEIYYLYYYDNYTAAGYLHYSISAFGATSIAKLDELIA